MAVLFHWRHRRAALGNSPLYRRRRPHADYPVRGYERFAARRPDAFEFALRSRVLLLRHENGVELDVCLGALEFEVRSVARAVTWRSADGMELKVCCAEDLIVHKAFASRDEDWIDVQRVMEVQGGKLHIGQIFEELRPLAALKEDDSIITRLERMMKKQGLL